MLYMPVRAPALFVKGLSHTFVDTPFVQDDRPSRNFSFHFVWASLLSLPRYLTQLPPCVEDYCRRVAPSLSFLPDLYKAMQFKVRAASFLVHLTQSKDSMFGNLLCTSWLIWVRALTHVIDVFGIVYAQFRLQGQNITDPSAVGETVKSEMGRGNTSRDLHGLYAKIF